jgi:hypothetical protein
MIKYIITILLLISMFGCKTYQSKLMSFNKQDTTITKSYVFDTTFSLINKVDTFTNETNRYRTTIYRSDTSYHLLTVIKPDTLVKNIVIQKEVEQEIIKNDYTTIVVIFLGFLILLIFIIIRK